MAYWTGTIQCTLDLHESSTKYEHHVIQTWTLNGRHPPGGRGVYRATWTIEGYGKKIEQQAPTIDELTWIIPKTSFPTQFDIESIPPQTSDNWTVEQWSPISTAPNRINHHYFDGNKWTDRSETRTELEFTIGRLEGKRSLVTFKNLRGEERSEYLMIETKFLPLPAIGPFQPPNCTGSYVCRWDLVER